MKDRISYLFIALVISLILLTSASVVQTIVQQPAKPISTVAYNGREPQNFTIKYPKQGYVVVTSASQGYYNTYVVMCKY